MTAVSDAHERDVAQTIKGYLPKGWTAVRPKVDSKYSDVKILDERRRTRAWVEVKMSHSDNLFNARPHYKNRKWVYTTVDSAVKQFVIDKMTENPIITSLIRDLTEFLGRDNFDILSASKPVNPGLSSDAGRLAIANRETVSAYNMRSNTKGFKWSSVDRPKDPRPVISWYEFKDFFAKHPKYGRQTFASLISSGSIRIFTNLATTHYNQGKKERVDYIQTGPDFYRLGRRDPLRLGTQIPLWHAKGNLKMRIALGETRGGRTEIMPELKSTGVVRSSPYGCDPRNKTRGNPFQFLMTSPHIGPLLR